VSAKPPLPLSLPEIEVTSKESSAWHQHKVDVVGHLTPRQHAHFGTGQVTFQQTQVGDSIGLGKETRW
jgi:hypothetical protein